MEPAKVTLKLHEDGKVRFRRRFGAVGSAAEQNGLGKRRISIEEVRFAGKPKTKKRPIKKVIKTSLISIYKVDESVGS
jgi:hypothetical protein